MFGSEAMTFLDMISLDLLAFVTFPFFILFLTSFLYDVLQKSGGKGWVYATIVRFPNALEQFVISLFSSRAATSSEVDSSEVDSNGVEVSRKISKAASVEEADRLYDNFMRHSYRYREELVFATRIFKKNRLEGKSLGEAWIDVTEEAMEHGKDTENPKFYSLVLKEIRKTHVDFEIYGEEL